MEKEKRTRGRKRIDLTGRKVGKLTVIAYDHTSRIKIGVHRAYWRCRCECGEEVIRLSGSLRSGGERSACGKCRSVAKQSRSFERHNELVSLLQTIIKALANNPDATKGVQ